MHRLVMHSKLDRAAVAAVLRPRQQPVLEGRSGDDVFDAIEGPVWS